MDHTEGVRDITFRQWVTLGYKYVQLNVYSWSQSYDIELQRHNMARFSPM
jgi:hypothetical protein